MHSSIFQITLIFLLYWNSVTIAGIYLDCDWSLARYQCPLYGTLEWDCLQTRLNCGAGERYHCVRGEAGDWVEVCAQEKICSKGEEPVYSTSGIICQPCSDPERFEPQENTPSYTYSECRRKKKVCPVGVSTECQNGGDNYSQNRECRCMYEMGFIPQGYDLSRDTWRCAVPDQLNCVKEPCPETADGRKQFRGPDYRCSPDVTPPPPTITHTPPYRRSTQAYQNVTRIPMRNEDDSASPMVILVQVIAVILIIVALCCLIYMAYNYLKRKTVPPGQPTEPFEASGIGYNEVCLTWLPPENNGGCPVSSYILEWQEDGSDEWTPAVVPVKDQHVTYVPAPGQTSQGPLIRMDDSQKLTYTVTGLKDGASYLFRVRAKNKCGVGEPLLMKENISTKEYKVPGMPLDLSGDFDKQRKCIMLSWKPPEDDGGKAVIGYGVEYQSVMDTADNWVHAAIVKEDTGWTGSNGFTGGMIYRFRVSAHNEKGIGEICHLETPIKFLSPPSAPAEIKVINVECDSVKISIQPPDITGGLTVERYWIRHKLEGEDWLQEDQYISHKASTSAITVRVTKLTPEMPYYFGVCADNALGKGDFLDTGSAIVLPRKLVQPDRPEGPIEVSDIRPTQLRLSWKPPKNDGGSPIISYIVSKKSPYQTYSIETTVGKTKDTEFLVTNLEEGRGYLFYVRAQNKIGNSEALEVKNRTSVAKVPGKPTGPLRCTNLTHNSVTLTWNPPADDGGAHITGYVIERLYSYHNALLESKHVNDRTTSCTFRNLKEDDRYAFRICAENKKGRSQHLETDEPVVPIRKKSVPGPPDSLKAKPKDGKIALSWKPPKDNGWSKIEKYHIYKNEVSGPKVLLEAVEATFNSYNVDNLSAEKQYYFEVVAENDVGCGEAARTEKPVSLQEQKKGVFGFFGGNKSITEKQRHSSTYTDDEAYEATEDTHKNETAKCENGVEKTVAKLAPEDVPLPEAEIPGPPVGPLRVENVTDSSVDLTWCPPAADGGAEITRYEIEYHEYRPHQQPDWIQAGTVGGSELTFTVKGLQEGTEYSFKVMAHNEEGPSKPLESESATKTRTKLVKPDAPEQLEIIRKDKNAVRLRWKKPTDFGRFECTHFVISKRHSVSEEWQMIAKVPPNELSYWVTDLPYKDVYFSVAAENAAGIGQPAVTEKPETITYPKGPPSVPSGPLRAVDIDDTELTLVWGPPEFDGDYDIEKYSLRKREWPAKHWDLLESVPGQVKKFNVTGLTRGKKYCFSVQAVNKKGGGESLETDGYVITKTLTVPLPPAGPLQYSDVTDTSIKLKWNPPDDTQSVTDYLIESCDTENSADFWDKCDIVPGYVTECTLTGLTTGHSYSFRIIAINAEGESESLQGNGFVRMGHQTNDTRL